MSASSDSSSGPGESKGFVGWVSELAHAHTRALAGVARSEGLSADDALDAVQEAFQTFLLLPQARSLVGDEEDSRKLLSVIVRNAARNMRRRAFRSRPHDDIAALPELASDLPSVDEMLMKGEDHVRLLGCVDKLGDVQRRVVILRMLEELSGEDVAKELNLRPDYVATLLYRAKRELLRCVSR